MNAFDIKLVAILSMVSSHAGIFLLPQYPILVAIGNVAFPIFAWLIANGARHSRDINRYLLRLVAFAGVSQIPFTLANQLIGSPLLYLNVFFTLSLGLLAIAVARKYANRAFTFAAFAACAIIAQASNTDYGAAGVLSIIAFYLLFDRRLYLALAQFFILVILPLAVPSIRQFGRMPIENPYFDHPVDPIALLAALAVIGVYNNNEGIRMKYFFYAFYPLQYIAIYLVLVTFPA